MKPTLYIVGDSTLSKFDDRSYFYPRYGYGTQLNYYLDEDKINIVNLALSGRSSKSFLNEENYQLLKKSIKSGDYLLIGFGHNNEKSDDVARFTSALKGLDDESSFAYSLNEYYIKLAKEVNATPILCTPIVRLDLSKDYSGYSAHITEHGDYREAGLMLAEKVNILGIDLTTPTKELFLNLSVEEACLHHAITAAKYENEVLIPNYKAVDKAHLNIYGARYVAYLVCKAIKDSNHSLMKYLKRDLILPLKNNTLVSNPEYVLIPYKAPDIINYKPQDNFKVDEEGYFGTAFGVVDCNPLIKENGYIAKKENNKFIVGQYADKLYGKYHASADGIVGVFRQVDINDNFVMKAKAKIINLHSTKQTSFGLMLRDDMYLNQTSVRESTMNNYISAGFLTLNVSMNVIFARECTTELNMSSNIIDGFYDLGDEALLEITRLGQSITAKVVYKGIQYIKNYMDFDLVAVDRDYCYIGLYSGCGTVVEYTDVEFEITGKAIAA